MIGDKPNSNNYKCQKTLRVPHLRKVWITSCVVLTSIVFTKHCFIVSGSEMAEVKSKITTAEVELKHLKSEVVQLKLDYLNQREEYLLLLTHLNGLHTEKNLILQQSSGIHVPVSNPHIIYMVSFFLF